MTEEKRLERITELERRLVELDVPTTEVAGVTTVHVKPVWDEFNALVNLGMLRRRNAELRKELGSADPESEMFVILMDEHNANERQICEIMEKYET